MIQLSSEMELEVDLLELYPILTSFLVLEIPME